VAFYDPAEPRWAADPWPGYEELRRCAPVHRSPRGFWVLARHADCLAVLRDRRASADETNVAPGRGPDGPADGRVVGSEMDQLLAQAERDNRPFLFRDPPDHTRLRSLVSKAFTPRMVEGLRPRILQMVTELLDQAFEQGDVDLGAALAYPLPVRVICDMLGVPVADHERFGAWSAALARGLDPEFLLSAEVVAQRGAAIVAFAEYFFSLLAERRQSPGPDLLSQLAMAEDGGDTLSEGELLSTCILLLVAGHETTVNLIGGGVLALLEAPDQLARLRHDPELLRPGVEELLRFVSPVQLTGRALLDDVAVGDAVLPAGDLVIILLGSANRDPAVFAAPDRLDLGRADNRHLGFGFGVHHCLGAPLARLETQVAIGELVRRSRRLERSAEPLVWRENVVLRGLERLPVYLQAH
jgi:cytochrome P450